MDFGSVTTASSFICPLHVGHSSTSTARILSFDANTVAEVAYDDLEHVVVTRDFLNDAASFLGQR